MAQRIESINQVMKVLIANPAVKIAIDDKYERHLLHAGCRFSWSLKKKKDRVFALFAIPVFPGVCGGSRSSRRIRRQSD
jgi:hypothetical protein